MSRSRLIGASLLLLLGSLGGAQATTCSSSTLVSRAYSVARWCGDPPNAGTLRMTLRGGGFAEYANVPLDIFRAVVRTQDVAGYVTNTIQPGFERLSGPTALAARARQTEQPQRAEAPGAAPARSSVVARRPAPTQAVTDPGRAPTARLVTPVSAAAAPRMAPAQAAPAARSAPAAARPTAETTPLHWRGRPVTVPAQSNARPACATPPRAGTLPSRSADCPG